MPTPEQVYRGFVYLIGSERFGWYKIGMSSNAELRVRDLGILLPFQIKLFAVWRVRNPRMSEAEMHKRHADSRINGEWFSFTIEQAIEVIQAGPINGIRVFCISEDEDSLSRFTNLVTDVVKDLGKREGKLRGAMFMKRVREYMEQSGIENTKENKRMAIKRMERCNAAPCVTISVKAILESREAGLRGHGTSINTVMSAEADSK